MKIYITDLAAYNEGNLDGFWLDIECLDADEIQDEIDIFLEKQSEKYGVEREEYFVTDYDGISSEFGEYPVIDELVEYAENVDQYGQSVVDAAKCLDVPVESYSGSYDNTTDLAIEYAESTDLFGGCAETLERYFDYESFGRDLAMDYSEYDGYYFSNCY